MPQNFIARQFAAVRHGLASGGRSVKYLFIQAPTHHRHSDEGYDDFDDGSTVSSLEIGNPISDITENEAQPTPESVFATEAGNVVSSSWRDEVLRRPEFQTMTEDFQRHPCWESVRENMPIYPFTTYLMHEFTSRIDRTAINASRRRLLSKFEAALDVWEKWSVGVALSRSTVITTATAKVLRVFAVNIRTVSSPFRQDWISILKDALAYDHEELSLVFGQMMANAETRKCIMNLNEPMLLNLQNMLQTLISAKTTKRADLITFLGELVIQGKNIPPWLRYDAVRRMGDNPVGGGGFSNIWKGRSRHEFVALKVLRTAGDPQNDATWKNFCKEAIIWKQFKHRNTCPFYGISVKEFAPFYALVCPWMPNGDMLSYIKGHPETDRKQMLGEAALGLQYLHAFEPQVIHADFRAANVLIDAAGRPRIADFGLAKIMDANEMSSLQAEGNVRWQAPEVLKATQFQEGSFKLTTKTDVYAFACVCLEVFTGEVPWSDYPDGIVIREVCIDNNRPPRPTDPGVQELLHADMWEIMQQCWLTEPEKRPAMADVVDFLIPDSNWRDTMNEQVLPSDPLSMALRRCSVLTLSDQTQKTLWIRLLPLRKLLFSLRWTVAQAAMVITGIVLTTLGSIYARHRATYLAWGIILLFLAFELDRDYMADMRSLVSDAQHVLYVTIVFLLGPRFRDRTQASLWVV